MPIDIYDFRHDVRNVAITPEIRARFMRLEPGAVASRHSHDLGQEVFLILQGQCEFEIDGERAILGPGQMCFARTDQLHQVRVVGDEPMIMYLSVTPHIEPTHTWWDERGGKLPPRYGIATATERAATQGEGEPLSALAAEQVAAAEALAKAAATNSNAQETSTATILRAVAEGDRATAKAALDELWAVMYETSRSYYALAKAWNALAATVGRPQSDRHRRSSRRREWPARPWWT